MLIPSPKNLPLFPGRLLLVCQMCDPLHSGATNTYILRCDNGLLDPILHLFFFLLIQFKIEEMTDYTALNYTFYILRELIT